VLAADCHDVTGRMTFGGRGQRPGVLPYPTRPSDLKGAIPETPTKALFHRTEPPPKATLEAIAAGHPASRIDEHLPWAFIPAPR